MKLGKQFIIECIVLRMTGKHPFVLGKLPTELSHRPLLENNVVFLLYKNSKELPQ